MHPRERLLGMAMMLKKRGEPIPLDMLVAAEQLGLSLKVFDQPQPHSGHGRRHFT